MSNLPVVVLCVHLTTLLGTPQGPASNASTQVVRRETKRDKDRENEVAQLFESIRARLKLPRLGRIKERDILEKQICTAAIADANSMPHDANFFAVYRTSRIDLISPELNRVASFDALHPKSKGHFQRYSAAVWQTKDLATGETGYWVGVDLYWSAPVEFFDYHFTDGIYDRKRALKYVAAPCLDK